MKVGIMADTHDNLPCIQRALATFVQHGCEVIIHAGDYVAPFALKEVLKFPGRVYGVLGNNDGERSGLRDLMPELSKNVLRIQLGSCRIAVTHKPKKHNDPELADCDVVVCGHTHVAEITPGSPMVINPGECAGWLTGKTTVAILDTESKEVELLDLGAWA